MSHAWRALRHRNFKLFFSGQSISLIGTWMTRLATGWLVYRLTHSALLLGIVSFAGQILGFVLAPFAGVWVERLDRRKLLVWTQAAGAIQSLALAALTLAHVITLHEIIALSALQGVINAFDMPGRQSFLVQMVEDRQDLGNAIAINSSMVNGARLIGPAIAGIVIAAAGEGWCFLIDGVSYFAVIASLLLMRIQPLNIRRNAISMLEQMREGWDYVSTFRPIRTDPSALCAALPDGLALRRAAASLCRPSAARRPAYSRLADRSFGDRRAGVGAFPCGPQVGGRLDADDSDRRRDARVRADSLRLLACVVAVACNDGLRRLRLDADPRPPAIRSSRRWCRKTNAPGS